MTDDKEDALAWFLAGFAASGEGFNPDVLTDWDREDHPVRERFEAQYPEPEYADAVRDREAQAAFNRKVEREGLFAALPKVPRDTTIGDRANVDLWSLGAALSRLPDGCDYRIEDGQLVAEVDGNTIEFDVGQPLGAVGLGFDPEADP